MSVDKRRVQVSDKRLVRGKTDVNQLMPLKFAWAWDFYLQGMDNHWHPKEIPMGGDAALWKLPPEKGGLTADEKLMVKRNLGFFSTAETTITNNIVLATLSHISAPEVRQFMVRQAFEEAVHSHTFVYIVESLGLDSGEIMNMYHEIPSVENKDLFIIEHTRDLRDPNFTVDTDENLRRFIKNLIAQFLCMEGLFFYSGFVMILSLARRNLMTGIGEQYSLILRDEAVHLSFGSKLIQSIRDEVPGAWNADMEKTAYSMIDEAMKLEYEYARDCLPRGIMGLNADLFDDYVKHMADRRLGMLGLDPVYSRPNPFEWCSEAMDLPKEKNFFETTVTEYDNVGDLDWDD